MNPFAVVENIPSDWTKIDIAIYHCYMKGFRMYNKLNIKVMPISDFNKKSAEWSMAMSTGWPLKNYENKPRD